MITVRVTVDLPTGGLEVVARDEPSVTSGGDELVAAALLTRCVNSVGAHYQADVKKALTALRDLTDAVGAVPPPQPRTPVAGDLAFEALALASKWEADAGEGPVGLLWRVAARELREVVGLVTA